MVFIKIVLVLTLLHVIQNEAKVIYKSNGYAMSCADHFRAGQTRNGYYLIIEQTSSQILTVYCDFESEPGKSWTLAMSYSLFNAWKMQGQPFTRKPLTVNFPVNSGDPNWFAYRMSKSSMNNIARRSTHFRFTCNFKNYIKSLDFKDYLRGKLAKISPLTFVGNGLCKQVEYISIRDHSCSNCKVAFWQGTNSNYMFHTDSTVTNCDFKANQGAVYSEDNFGLYYNAHMVNKNFGCTATPNSTTQLWLGGKI